MLLPGGHRRPLRRVVRSYRSGRHRSMLPSLSLCRTTFSSPQPPSHTIHSLSAANAGGAHLLGGDGPIIKSQLPRVSRETTQPGYGNPTRSSRSGEHDQEPSHSSPREPAVAASSLNHAPPALPLTCAGCAFNIGPGPIQLLDGMSPNFPQSLHFLYHSPSSFRSRCHRCRPRTQRSRFTMLRSFAYGAKPHFMQTARCVLGGCRKSLGEGSRKRAFVVLRSGGRGEPNTLRAGCCNGHQPHH